MLTFPTQVPAITNSNPLSSRLDSLTPFPFPAKTVPSPRVLFRIALLLLSILGAVAQSTPGLAVKFEQDGRVDRAVVPYPALHVNSNEPAAPFLKPGPFTAEITGYISVDLRAQHTFTAELTGQAALLINGKEILNTATTKPLETRNPETQNYASFTSTAIRLSKGTNAFLIRYTSPTNTPATFRLLWSSKNTAVPIPIPTSALSHSTTPDLAHSLSLQNGAFLYFKYQCARCHAPEQKSDTPFDAPTFNGIGSRLKPDWIASWIQNPSPGRMPALFHGEDAQEKSRAAAAYLATLTAKKSDFVPTADLRKIGATLVEDLRCRSCHTLPSEPASADRRSLQPVPEKFHPGALVAYLQNPHAHYSGNPMPNFKLSAAEAQSIAAFLLGTEPPTRPTFVPPSASSALGKELVQKSGCLNCHASDLPNQFAAPKLARLKQPESLRGCLADEPANAPRFTFTTSERADLAAFLSSDLKTHESPNPSLSPAGFALRATEFLRCNQCHIDSTLPAPLDLGGKLKPEWTARFIAGENLQKPRPWLKTRMPAFPAYATNLAVGLAALHGYPAHTFAEPPPSPSLVKTGETLIGSTGGFSCVACHAVGSSTVQLVVESPGINLAYSDERLLPGFFHRWLMNPIAIDPSTKMPAYFDAEGRSQLTEFFEGDADKQIDAMWHYIRSLGAPP